MMIASGIVRAGCDLLAGGRDGVEADVGEEDDPGRRGDAAEAERREVRQVVESQPWTPSTTNRISTPILIITIAALTFADSLAPRISSSVQSPIRTTAGRLKTPPASGACESAPGS
jgi:hypothetical protein